MNIVSNVLLYLVLIGCCCPEDTKYMTSGKTYGKGIYMAEKLSVALVYAMRRSKSHWPNARIAGEAVIVAVCEVVDK